jgi:hypothetical protein
MLVNNDCFRHIDHIEVTCNFEIEQMIFEILIAGLKG